MIVAGIGARAAAAADEIAAAVRAACLQAGVDARAVGILAGMERSAPALAGAAKELGMQPMICDLSRLLTESGNCLTHSERSMAATGLPSVAEASALVAAGAGGRLIQSRIAYRTVTVALAATKETPA